MSKKESAQLVSSQTELKKHSSNDFKESKIKIKTKKGLIKIEDKFIKRLIINEPFNFNDSFLNLNLSDNNSDLSKTVGSNSSNANVNENSESQKNKVKNIIDDNLTQESIKNNKLYFAPNNTDVKINHLRNKLNFRNFKLSTKENEISISINFLLRFGTSVTKYQNFLKDKIKEIINIYFKKINVVLELNFIGYISKGNIIERGKTVRLKFKN